VKSRILIVDDHEEGARDLRSIFLRSIDCEVELAFDGEQAITKAIEGKPDLILLDIQLPVLDGFQVLARLKKKGVSTRVIMFSAYRVDIATAVQAIKEGACDYVTKPIEPPKLVEHIKRALLTESTINLNLANDATPLLKKLLESVEKLSKTQGQSQSPEDYLSDHYLPQLGLREKLAKHWLFAVLSVSAVVAATTWQIVMNLYVYPRDFELNQLRSARSQPQLSPSPTAAPPR
jgi:CheY-like chemotaxis protein